MTGPDQCQALVKIDGKVSRALQSGKGIKFSPADLEMLASIGVFGLLAEAKARKLEGQARHRQTSARFADAGGALSVSSVPAGNPNSVDCVATDQIAPAQASSGRLRAQRMFVRQ